METSPSHPFFFFVFRGTEKDVPYTLTGCVPTTCTLPSAEARSEFFAAEIVIV